jgi:hypothetical protein
MYDDEKTEKPASAIDEIQRISKMRLEQCNAELADMADQSAKMEMRRELLSAEAETLHRILDASRREDQKEVNRPAGGNPSNYHASPSWSGG